MNKRKELLKEIAAIIAEYDILDEAKIYQDIMGYGGKIPIMEYVKDSIDFWIEDPYANQKCTREIESLIEEKEIIG